MQSLLLPCVQRHARVPARLQKYVPLIDKLPPKPRYLMRRALENWEFGAGKDYKL